ncbi:MAG: HAMP domain-containing sensor histidine kinase [Emticicia sp.]|nr:HAMP domain-containing sensor histidine kinase [Emticicia sp.]
MIINQMQLPLAKAIPKKTFKAKEISQKPKILMGVRLTNQPIDSSLRVPDTSIKMIKFAFSRNQMNDSVKRILTKMISVVQKKAGASRLTIHLNPDSSKSFSFSTNQPDTNMAVPSIQLEKLSTKSKSNFTSKKSSGDTLITLRITQDSLRRLDVAKAFRRKLIKSAIDLPFEVFVSPKIKSQFILSGITVESPSYSKSFTANFSTYASFLLQKIVPQILFSLFLITITSCAFWFIFRSLQQQKRLTLLRNDLISNITHELKTPISTVSVAIEALSSFGGLQNPELTKEYLEISKNELNRLSVLVDSVLKMAIFEQQKLDLNLSEINLKQLVEQVLNTMKLQFEKCQAQVQFETHGQDFIFRGDEIHLTNVVYNLLDNSLKYTTNNPKILIVLSEKNKQFTLTFTDNGNGIPKEFHHKIFDKFFRVPTGNTHNTKGYGLGLSYVKTIIEQHKGTISLVNKQGEGSVFKIVF